MATKSISGQMVKKMATNKGHREGRVAKAIEKQTAKLPSDIFLWSSLGAMGVALAAKLMKKDHLALFIGQWAAPFLVMGLYNKVVKTHGHDKTDRSKITAK